MSWKRSGTFGLSAFALAVVAGLVFPACEGDESGLEPPHGAAKVASDRTPTVTPTSLPTVSVEDLEIFWGDEPKAGEIDPCSLVTTAEVEQILGQSLTDIHRHNSFTVLCEYISEEPIFSSANIRLEYPLSEDKLRQELEDGEVVARSKAEPVEGIGDEAYSVGQLLYVRKADVLVLTLVAVNGGPDLNAAKELARIALRRLPQHAPPSP